MSSLNEDEIWKFIDTFYNEFSLVDHQINSYEHFVNYSLKAIIEQFNPIEVYTDVDKSPVNKDIVRFYHSINVLKIYLTKPYHQENNGTIMSMYPSDARLRNLTYESKLYVDMEHTIKGIDKNNDIISNKVFTSKKITIGKLPIMLKTNFCP